MKRKFSALNNPCPIKTCLELLGINKTDFKSLLHCRKCLPLNALYKDQD